MPNIDLGDLRCLADKTRVRCDIVVPDRCTSYSDQNASLEWKITSDSLQCNKSSEYLRVKTKSVSEEDSLSIAFDDLTPFRTYTISAVIYDGSLQNLRIKPKTIDTLMERSE